MKFDSIAAEKDYDYLAERLAEPELLKAKRRDPARSRRSGRKAAARRRVRE